jgi:hypothetical protein
VVVVVLALLLGVGGFAAFVLTGKNDDPRTEPSTPARSSQPTNTGTSAAPTGSGTADVRLIAKGQCIVNDGTNDDPKIRAVTCGAVRSRCSEDRHDGGRQRVQRRERVHRSLLLRQPLNSLDFVLCLRKR